MTTIQTHSPQETVKLGRTIGERLKSGLVILLSGTLGAGKTHFTRGLALGWGTTDHPTSPTFALVNQYRRPTDDQHFYHIDCYRLNQADDIWSVGFSDILDDPDAIIVIEWPERIQAHLPEEHLWLNISAPDEDTRVFEFNAVGEDAKFLVKSLENLI